MSTSPARIPGSRFELFAVTAPGLESITAGELNALGVKGRQQPGGVAFEGGMDRAYLTNLWLRTASRVLLRMARFHASTFYELERRAKKIPWTDFLPATGPTQNFEVRIVDDQCEVSADTSGDLLHRRGYRQEVAKAPLRETLAAAMILASGWKKNEPLLDPMCGSGTIPIEAACIARRKAPGLGRNFQFMNWASFDPGIWNEIVAAAKDSIVDGPLEIRGSDRDAGGIEAAARNAERAGVAADIQFSAESVSSAFAALSDVTDGEGWVITNPPYGIRVGETDDLRNL